MTREWLVVGLVGSIALAALGAEFLSIGCATIGSETDFPARISTTGVGPFREFTADETGSVTLPTSSIVGVGTSASGRGMVAGGQLFYSFGEALSEPPTRDATLHDAAVDWNQFGPRTIHRGLRRDGSLSFLPEAEVLAASQTWEGTNVFDPWVVVLPNGQARLYYAADGGIGVAEASTIDGVFTRLGDAPILTPNMGEHLSSPTIVQTADGTWLMYFTGQDGIYRASSTDGIAFARAEAPLVLTVPAADPPADAGGSTEIQYLSPGASVATTPTGRRVIRLYFQVIRSDQSAILSMAASLDGLTFERFEDSVLINADEAGDPAPLVVDDKGTTLLYCTIAKTFNSISTRALIGTIAPASVDPLTLALTP